MYEKPMRGAFVGRSDAELERIRSARYCAECGSSQSLEEVASMAIEAREAFIAFHRLDSNKALYICTPCYVQLVDDDE